MKKTIIFVLVLISILVLSGCEPQTPKCKEDWIEYQGNCCLDTNYNNKCDQLDKKQATHDGTVYGSCQGGLGIECYKRGAPAYIEDWEEECRFECESNQCIASSCRIVDCIDDRDCREGAFCNQGKCEKIGWSEPKPKGD